MTVLGANALAVTPAIRVLGQKLDSIPFSRYHILVIAVLGFVGFVEGYDLAMTGSPLVLAKKPLHLTPGDIRLLTVAATLMLCVEGFAASAISDHWSRKRIMQIGVVGTTLFTLMIPLVQNAEQLITVRLLTGLAGGFAVSAPFPIGAELMPAQHRRTYGAVYEMSLASAFTVLPVNQHPSVSVLIHTLLVGLAPMPLSAQQKTDLAIRIHENDLGGVVRSANRPEAGVWVIAETTGLPTPFAKIVVTDDQGRYVIPDLPQANYDIWVRGYGLIDSPRVVTKPGKIVNLMAVLAPNAAAAAQYYPAIYWYSMLNIPDQSQFSGPERDENMPKKITAQWQWLNTIKTTGCIACHGIGTLGTRTVPAALGHFDSSAEAWQRRIQSGQAETNMVNTISRLDPQLAFQYFGDWTDRITRQDY